MLQDAPTDGRRSSVAALCDLNLQARRRLFQGNPDPFMDNHEGNADACHEEHGPQPHKDDPGVVIDAQYCGIAVGDDL